MSLHKIFSSLLLLVSALTSHAVQLTSYEYWIDDGVDGRLSVNSSSDEITVAVDVAGLKNGVHFFNIRLRNSDSEVSSPSRYIFYIPDASTSTGTLTSCEYWLDDDYASRVVLSESSDSQTFVVDVSSIDSGVHFLNYRAFADGGVVGNLSRYLFYIPDAVGNSGTLSSYEYWLDDDYDAKTVVPGYSEDQTFIVDVSALPSGVHFLNYRAFADGGVVGNLSRYLFYIPDNVAASGSPIIGYEYSFNDNVTYVPVSPCLEFEMKATAIPVPDIKETAKIDSDSSFSFADGKATMTNNASVSFLLRFRNEGGETSMPICSEYDENYTITKDMIPMQLQKSILLDKVTSGDFQSVSFDIPSTGVYYLRSTQACDMYIFGSDGKLKTTIASDAMLKTSAFSATAGSYYGIIFNTLENDDYPEKQVGIRFMTTNNSVPTPEIKYENETVTITCLQDDASIYYTVDGSMPDETKSLYTKPFELKHNAEVKAIAKAADYADSFIATLKVDSYKVDTPEISFTNLKIYISCATPEAQIFYTIDGSDPATNGQLYTAAVPMTSNCTVKAVAKREFFHDSETAQFVLDISNVKCSAPTLSVSGNLLVMSTITEGATIHYTTDGTTPSNRSIAYTSPILLERNCVYKAIAVKSGEIDSDVSQVIVDWFQAATPEFSYSDGMLTITCNTPDNSIYYEIGGADPTKESNRYVAPVRLNDNRIVKAFAVAPGFNDSEIVSYSPSSFTCAAPQVKFDGRAIELTSSTQGAAIYYTIDGSNPGIGSEVYGSKTVLPGLCTVNAIAVMENMNNSPVTTYTLPCYYNSGDVYVQEAGSMSKAFEWCGGYTEEESLAVHGSLGDADFATIRSLGSLLHLDLEGVTTASVPDEAFKDMSLLTLTMPKCNFTAGSRLLRGCKEIAAVVWNSATEIPLDLLDGMDLPNMLLYVKYAAVANVKFGNIIVDNVANSITLSDAEHSNFFCPIEFTARKISYTHSYSQQSGFDRCAGWESIALPFSPTHIVHETRGEMSPFAAGEKDKKQFWLCELTQTGFASVPMIEANKPYIIAMPNCDRYSDDYILAGNVTFSGSNVTVFNSDEITLTSKGDNLFVPNFVTTPKDRCMALNVGEAYNGHPEGSLFVRGLRDARPFEAYVTNHSSDKMFIIGFDSSDVYVLPESESVSVESHDGVLTIRGLRHGDWVDVVTVDGIHVCRQTALDYVLSLENGPLGPVVITVSRAGHIIFREKQILK